ncbi:MAG: PilZ domain-containing protein [Syntrophales bacterium]|jgi:hypothetical protein|nr:PilZ domain-containing protein [Syntrophales bacterium]
MTDIKKDNVDGNIGEKEVLQPWLFKHNELLKAISTAVKIDQKKLTNILNYKHFKGEHLNLMISHPSFQDEILVKLFSEACLGEMLVCRWGQNTLTVSNFDQYKFNYLVVSYDQSVILVPVERIEALEQGLSIPLPEASFLISDRLYPRFISKGVKADLWQNGFQASGSLIDFTPNAFRVRVCAAPPSSFRWFNNAVPSQVRLYEGKDVFYSGNCKSLYEKHDGANREIVFSPIDNMIQRFSPKALRNPRRQGSPPLHAIFEHPFTKKTMQHLIFDVSTSGFSLFDQSSEIVLFTGMIIPQMSISYAGILDIHCKVQVIYRRTENDGVRFGIAILDMDLTNYRKLFQILNNANSADEGMLNKVSLDELWEFFFDTDFIYPQKYTLIQTFKDEFKDIYKRLYEEAPDIASYFTYQKNGHIYGHISMLRAYERTWMIHHLAARPMGGRPIGLAVLKQMIYYLNDVNHLPSANMDFAITYFRPGNKFPEKIFGGFADYHGNFRHCSVNLFAYMTYPVGKTLWELPSDWFLKECNDCDSFDFQQFNRNNSGGLFPSIVKRQKPTESPSLEETFSVSGFTRGWKMYILYHINAPKAFIIDEKSDMGLNLSNLLNGLKIFVADENVNPEIIFAAVSQIRNIKPDEALSLMIYPAEYAYKNNLGLHTKEYVLWILDMQYGNEFIEYLGRKFRIRL